MENLNELMTFNKNIELAIYQKMISDLQSVQSLLCAPGLTDTTLVCNLQKEQDYSSQGQKQEHQSLDSLKG